ncbi:MAG: hypothetical protein HEQ24_06730 [Dolichospermum sp. BR01]|nr:hypothetical protein [Dolichospermum sp. BR01]
MANIVISELRPAGSDLFMDSESYLTDLTDNELHMKQGGSSAICAAMLINLLKKLPKK